MKSLLRKEEILDANYAYDYYLPTDAILLKTDDSTLGNGLSVSDTVTLLGSDGTTVIDAFSSPADPGDGYAIERVDYAGADSADNWAPATDYCDRGRSPARLNGAAGGICEPLIITEVMANPLTEDTGEFIEIFNAGSVAVDLAGLKIADRRGAAVQHCRGLVI